MKKLIFAMMWGVALLLSSCSMAQQSPTQAKATYQLQAAKDFSATIAQQPAYTILDVRSPEEYQEGHIKNAVNINWEDEDFEKQIAAFDKTNPIMVYCWKGGRSSEATDFMKKQGFTHIIELNDGLSGWIDSGLPTVK